MGSPLPIHCDRSSGPLRGVWILLRHLSVLKWQTGVRHGISPAERVTDAVPQLTGRQPIAFERYAEDHRAYWQA